MEKQFVTDSSGKKIAIILPIKEYQKLIEELEDREDMRLYDEAKKEDDGTRIAFEDYVKQRSARHE